MARLEIGQRIVIVGFLEYVSIVVGRNLAPY
jgi:hypothetical protein